ncbi:hypothetical protein LS684_18570 [Cytobacillus spongiae]|uniref:hypothetical protein n=1 Tax=Cytobacillus spongiae TaxID=2901381 RepID=UPI001F3E6E2C|nr:hypothetical protein [Cytobacillus spongiae]UII55606.1 hypothetical protein LS684_18570 [Cytobacillus spongiae]
MSSLQELYDLTVEFHLFVQNVENDHSKRESTIEQVNDYIDRRQEFISNVKEPTDLQERKMAEELIKLDKEISLLLKGILGDIKTDMLSLKSKKVKQNRYENPYKAPLNDGMFFDKRN